MSQKFHVLVSMLSIAVAMGVGVDTTAGENPITLEKNSKAMKSGVAQVKPPKQTPKDVPIGEQTSNNDVFSEANRPKLFYIAGVAAVAVLIVCIYSNRGFVAVASILAYVGALSSMSMLIRNCYVNEHFKYPQFLTSTHFLCTATVGSVILLIRKLTQGHELKVPDMECFLKGLLPVAVAFTLSLGFANTGLLLTNAHFYEMVGSSTALCTVGVGLAMGKAFDMRLAPALGVITLAIFVIAFGELKLSLLGAAACFAGVLMRAIKSTVQHNLMSGAEWKSMDPVEVAVWTSSTCFMLMSIWSIATEGAEPWKKIVKVGPFVAVLYTCIGASILNIAALFVLRELGPVAQQIVGQLKGILAIVGSVALFGEAVSMQQIAGYAILLCGIFYYNRTDAAIKEEKKQEAAKQADETTKIAKV